MRLLACFSKPPVILDDTESVTTAPSERPDRPRRKTKAIPDPQQFIPTSIPELHPEYAHSEPYCFAARTDSARMIVDKMRGAKGEPAVDRAAILKEQGVVVVRGPSYGAATNKTTRPLENMMQNGDEKKEVELRVESPTSGLETKIERESDEENRHKGNGERKMERVKSKKSSSTKSLRRSKSNKKIKSKGRASAKDLKAVPTRASDKTHSKADSLDHPRASDAGTSTTSTDVTKEKRKSSLDKEIEKRMDNVPKELREPIMVPRVSWTHGQSKPLVSASPHNSLRMAANPTTLPPIPDGDTSSNKLPTSHIPLAPTSFMADIPQLTPDEMFQDASQGSGSTHSYRSKRKSKPFMPARSLHDTSMPRSEDEDESYNFADRQDILPSIPQPQSTRQTSVNTISDDIQVVETDTVSVSAAARSAAQERVNPNDLLAGNESGIRRRASSKRKTVSFHEASPVIIEPNLRAPQSVPRGVMLAKGHVDTPVTVTAEVPRDLMPALKNGMGGGRRASQRELSDSSCEFEDASVEAKLAQRLSVSVVKDKQMLRAASQRQSRAVAKAMAEQIKGVPKSAMLAYAENDFVPSDDYEEEDDSNASLGMMRRRSKVVKSVRLSEVRPGVVPRPPPPPPFEPVRGRVQSVRAPPPPPSSPLHRM